MVRRSIRRDSIPSPASSSQTTFGRCNTQFNNLRADPVKNLDLSVLKRIPITEQKYLQIRFETFNTTNRVTFGGPGLTPTASTFGLITTQANTPRRLQVGARLVW